MRPTTVAIGVMAALAVTAGLAPGGLRAQDVELLAEHYGTTPPPAYFEELTRNPGAYRPSRGWRSRLGLRAVVGNPGAAALRAAAVLGRRAGGVLGTIEIPLLLGLYSDSPGIPSADVGATSGQLLTQAVVQQEFFDGPNSRFATIPEFYSELSGGLLTLVGETQDWFQASLSGDDVAGSSNGLSSLDDVGEFIIELLVNADDGSIDWGDYDNDGPDGVPNSGDDDGYVDLLAVMHPTSGAECGGGGTGIVWSHYWQLGASAGQVFTTSTVSANGGFVLVDDYTIQPVLSCDASTINEIGVFAHELGHGFGLPDLYAVGASHGGVGRWGLMGTGAWGCNGQGADVPCHMTAWSKEVLGWVNVTTLPADADLGVLSLDPVETTGDVIRIDAGDGSGDYYLLENRQRLGFDVSLPAPGLFVWQIDTVTVEGAWAANQVNTSASRMGVWLRQADGQNSLAQAGERGDAGDPFPGSAGATAFHAGTVPSSFTYSGLNGLNGIPVNTAAGVTLLDIQQVGDQMQFRALTRYPTVTLQSAGLGASGSVFTVDGVASAGTTVPFSSAPFQTHALEAGGGASNGPGFRYGFQAWSDGQPRVRGWATGIADSTLTASYGISEVSFDITLVSPVPGVVPGVVVLNPDSESGWIREAIDVSVWAQPKTGLAFREWTGALLGEPNPTTVVISTPGTASAVFDLTYMVSSAAGMQVTVAAASDVDIQFTVTNANQPVAWVTSGVPLGLSFVGGTVGALTGAPLAMGDFVVTVQATDAIGLTDSIDVALNVGPPDVGLQAMAEPFLGVGTVNTALETFLDLQGNGDGTYDLGDFRVWVLGNPSHPVNAPAATLLAGAPRKSIVIPLFEGDHP
ncbi:MAG: M6 family metalloprotease domain-containing protein [Gemmatimonadetes bacterium]|nr:M6 family metalloprotease domain-containing protein [Gemmatimonadota bacterium]